MRFAIRDDDLNYFYTPQFIEDNIKDIWDICPISMSAVPFIKGNWLENTRCLESYSPKNVPFTVIKNIQNDDKVFDIANNEKLVKFITEKMKEEKVYLTIHGIHHRNEDEVLPLVKNNYSIGAEFCTNRDLTDKLNISIQHLEKVFGQEITIFTPPQNLYSQKGLNAIVNNNLNICGYLPSIRENFLYTIKTIGLFNYFKLFNHKIHNRKNKRAPYPYLMLTGQTRIMDHKSLQPGTNIKELYSDFEYVYSKGGNFVLSTHSYGFNHNMKNSSKKMGDVLREFLVYVKQKDNVEFVALDKILEVT